jgi:hypothetical protein
VPYVKNIPFKDNILVPFNILIEVFKDKKLLNGSFWDLN